MEVTNTPQKKKQAGAELCQAQLSLKLACHQLGASYGSFNKSLKAYKIHFNHNATDSDHKANLSSTSTLSGAGTELGKIIKFYKGSRRDEDLSGKREKLNRSRMGN